MREGTITADSATTMGATERDTCDYQFSRVRKPVMCAVWWRECQP